jgi:hypothetical protein
LFILAPLRHLAAERMAYYYIVMDGITITKEEYRRLKRFSSAYVRIARQIVEAERFYPYDYPWIQNLKKQALLEHRRKKTIEAESVDKALKKFSRK